MKTKKLLVPYDLKNPDKKINGFLYPTTNNDQTSSFTEIKTGKEWHQGIIVYIGRDISENDLFARIVDSGKKIESVQKLVDILEEYLKQVTKFKIGDVIGIENAENDMNFKLIKLQKPKRATNDKLP